MNRINRIRKRSIGTLIVLLFVLSFSITPALLFSDLNFGPGLKNPTDEEQYLNLSTNYLFKGTSYTFNLDDFYDDANLYKVYTGAKFQTEMFNGTSLEWSGVVNNDTVTPVDNDETQYGASSGDYNGTYTFTNIPDGTEGLDIDFIDEYGVMYGTNSYAKIIAELDGHKKILEIYDYDNTELVYIQNNFPEDVLSGTIEFWHYAEDDGVLAYYIRQGSTSAIRGYIRHSGATVKTYNVSVLETIVTGDTNNVWHYIRFDFNCTSDKFDVYYDGVKVADQFTFYTVTDFIDNIHFTTTGLYTVDTSKYLDAIAFKTDNYFATESFDYTTEEGVYYGTYDFRDEIGETGIDIDLIDNVQAGAAAEVIDSYANHKAVVNMSSTMASAIWHYIPANPVSGTFEFYWKDVTGNVCFRLRDETGDIMLYIYFYDAGTVRIRYGDGAGGYIYTDYYTTTTSFPHFKIQFDCTTDKASVWCEGVLILDNQNFDLDLDAVYLDRTRWYFGVAGLCYVDAYGESWDTTSHSGYGYTASWNANPYDLEPLLENYFDVFGMTYNTSVRVVPYLDEHSNVLEIYDNSLTGGVSIRHYYDIIQTDSTVEFWWQYDGTLTYLNYLFMKYYESATERIRIIFGYTGIGQIMSHNGSEYISIVSDLPINTFYHIKIVFDDSANTFDFYVDSVDMGTFDYFANSVVGINRIYMNTRSNGDNYHHWFDAFGIVGVGGYEEGDNLEGWDKDYTIGENLYPDNINMISGSYDYTDNMKANDDSSTNFTSTHTDGYIYETPHQWDDFTFTNGTGDDIGDIETIDADYSNISADYSSESGEVWCLPDGDTAPNDWNDGVPTPHWDDLDEDPLSSDGNHISEITDSDLIDEFSVSNGDIEGGIVYQATILVDYFGMGTVGCDAYIDLYFGGSWQGYKKMTRTGPQWHPWSVSGDQTDVNNTQVRFKSYVGGIPKSNQVKAFRVKVLYEKTDLDLDVQVDIQVDDPDCSSIEYFKYSHKTNVSATIDLDIWNWDTSTWFEIESVDNFASFDDDSFTLGSTSVYVNSSFGVRIRFQLNTGSDDFELQIDRFRLDYLTTPAELEMTITFPFANYNEDLLAMTVQSWQKTNISQTITFKIWNYNTETWVQISSSSDITFTKKEYNTTSPINFISPTGVVKLNWTGSNTTNNFELHIDYLFIQIFYKLDLVHSKLFDTNGIYRYRWAVLGSIQYTQWVTFEVVDPEDNFHAISESDNPTRWLLQGAEISPVENFTDDIAPSSAWDLYDTSPTGFNKYIPELDNYLIDYITFYGSSYESPAQWGDFVFTKGAGNTVGELETNDADEAIIDAGGTFSGESYLGTIKPADSDILTNWNEGDAAPHWSKLDEGVGGAPDGGNIAETSEGVHDKWNFDSLVIPADEVVTTLIFYCYSKMAAGLPRINVITSVGASGAWFPTMFAYGWDDFTVGSLDFGQAELDAFWMDIAVLQLGAPNAADVECVYVEVYTSEKTYTVDYTMTWDVDDPESIENFNYDYRTTFAVDCDLDIYNWDTTGWLELESNTDVNWHADNYTLTDPYISVSDEIKVRFQSALTTTDFDMELDQIAIEYNSIYTISKKHNNTIPGYAYMQTNTIELISLNSSVYGSNYTLSSGDYFEVDFQTSSDSLINLILLRDGVVNKTLVLSQSGNPNFNRHTVQISVDETVEFDQLRFSSTFEDTDYVRIYDIKTYKYTLTGDYADFYVGSHQDYELYLAPDFYNLRIHDPHDGEVKTNINITISSGYNFHIYQPVKSILCRITLFSPEGDYLQFEDYHIKINRSLSGEYDQFDLVDTLFSADEETNVYIEIYDRFDASINNFSRLATSYIDLEIEVYSLQIKNLQTQKTTVDINTTHVYPLLSEESLYFMLAEDYYNISYYDTNDIYKSFLIYLDSNQAYELNRSQICFLAYVNQKGEHLYFDDYKTYINDSIIYENIFYREIGDNIGIEVKDIYGISIKNQSYTVVSDENYIPVVLTMYSLKVMSQQLCFNHINITRDPAYYASSYYWSEWIAPSEIIEFKLFAGYYKINLTNNEDGGYSYYSYNFTGDNILLVGSNNTIYNVLVNIANVNATIGNQITNVEVNITNQNSNINNTIVNIEINLSNVNSTLGTLLLDINTAISNINSSIITEIVSISTELSNINSSITNEILTISADLSNVNSSVISQLLTLGVNISNINGSIVNQIIDLGVDVSNINTSLSNQILSVGVDISNVNTSITNQILLMVADIENVNASIINQTLVILSDITNMNSTVLNQMALLGLNITNVNASITNQILDLSVDLTNINSSISNLLTNINISISNLENDIGTFYAFTNTSFINLNNVMNTSFINIETTIYSINQTISNLVIGVSNDIYLINGTITTMISQLETNLLLMNVSIDTALFDLGTTLNLIGSNITNNYILLNNSIYLNSLNINDSRIAIINNLLLINNTISALVSEVYSAVYLINNSIYTAVVDLGTYLSLMNNTISGNLSIVLKMNDFLTELYTMTMFSELLNWTDIGTNISLLTSQIDTWSFINNYKNQSVEIHLRYQDLIDNLTLSAQNTIEQYLPNEYVEYREWSEELQEYVGDWVELDPDDKTVDFGFYETEVPPDPLPQFVESLVQWLILGLFILIPVIVVVYAVYKMKISDLKDKQKARTKGTNPIATTKNPYF